MPCAVDVGAEQRRGVLEPAAGVDDAVVHDLAADHRRAEDVGIPDVADEARDFQVVDADGVGTGPHHGPHVLPVGDQLPGHMRAEVSVGADDEDGHR